MLHLLRQCLGQLPARLAHSPSAWHAATVPASAPAAAALRHLPPATSTCAAAAAAAAAAALRAPWGRHMSSAAARRLRRRAARGTDGATRCATTVQYPFPVQYYTPRALPVYSLRDTTLRKEPLPGSGGRASGLGATAADPSAADAARVLYSGAAAAAGSGASSLVRRLVLRPQVAPAVVGTLELPGDVFGVPVRADILQRVVRWQRAKAQQGTHAAKERSEVSGGGRKPWRQKGTGRARHGSIRAPQWRGGGIVHGPVPRSHAHALPKKVRRLGLKCALSAKAHEGRLLLLDSLAPPAAEQAKSKVLAAQLDALLATLPGGVLRRRLERQRGEDVLLPQPDAAPDAADSGSGGAEPALDAALDRAHHVPATEASGVQQPANDVGESDVPTESADAHLGDAEGGEGAMASALPPPPLRPPPLVRSVLLLDSATDGGDGGGLLRRAARNLVGVEVVPQHGANVYSILRRDVLVLTLPALTALVARLRTPINRRGAAGRAYEARLERGRLQRRLAGGATAPQTGGSQLLQQVAGG